MEVLIVMYLGIGFIAGLYTLFTEGELDDPLSSSFLLVFFTAVGPLFLLWSGISSLLESVPKQNFPSKPNLPSKPKKTDDELVEEFMDSVEILKKLYSLESQAIDIKITKSQIAFTNTR